VGRSNIVIAPLTKVKPTEVFDTFWHFAAERQRVFFARQKGHRGPWTKDPILQQYKFTNAYRASDRVSQFFIRHVAYAGSQSPEEILFRTLLFKLFNKIETWQLLEQCFGELAWNSYSYRQYDRVLSQALRSGTRIYSAAYIMASGHTTFDVSRKHQAHLKLIELMMRDGVPERLCECRTMREGFELIRSYPLIGNFLGYQLITDINYSALTDFSEMEFTTPGPGALDGIHKCFADLGSCSESDVIRLVTERQEAEFSVRGISFPSLWGRRLQLIDVQNLFCEVSKYARVRHPAIKGTSTRTRIKQQFRGNEAPIEYLYPPKWKLNTSLN
jgi:hypothetical protein